MYDGAMPTGTGAFIADRINHMLALRDMSPAQLARDSGLTPGAISKVLSGKSPNVRSDSVARIAAALEVSVDYLQGATDDPSPASGAQLPEYALEILESMRQLDSAQNYELLVIARALMQERESIRRMGLLTLIQEAADHYGVGEELDQLQDLLRTLEARRLEARRLGSRDAEKPA